MPALAGCAATLTGNWASRLPPLAMVRGVRAAGVPQKYDKLHHALPKAARDAGVSGDIEKGGMTAPVDKSSDEARAWLGREMETWRPTSPRPHKVTNDRRPLQDSC